MNEEEMKAMKLHENINAPGTSKTFIRRIPNGWMYEYYDFDGNIQVAVPVYEVLPIIQHIEPRK